MAHSTHQGPTNSKKSDNPDALVEIQGRDYFKSESGDQNPNALAKNATNLKDQSRRAWLHSQPISM